VKVEWAEEALNQLIAIRDYLQLTSPKYAESLLERIFIRAEKLNDNPQIGAEVPEYGQSAIREVYEHPYRIVYRIDSQLIQILAVIHSARRMTPTPPV
jgi:toxin ParE1/3/4